MPSAIVNNFLKKPLDFSVNLCYIIPIKSKRIMKYRIAKKNETTTSRYEVGGTVQVFTRSHKGLEAAIELANELKTFVVAFSVDCSTETVWTHESIDALHAAEMLNHYK